MPHTPFKNLSRPAGNTNAAKAAKIVPAVPGKSPPNVNEKRGNVTPDGETPIVWPEPGIDHNPIAK
jgi:hypothetical protein